MPKAKSAEVPLQITKVEQSEYSSGIPIRGWEAVRDALNIFGSGMPRSSRATEGEQLRAVGESGGGLAVAFYASEAPHMRGSTSQFVERMVEEAKPVVQSRGSWDRSYDYDGQGPFFKTIVEIGKADQPDEYVLNLSAAYVGDEVEKGLAEHLGVERGLLRKSVEVELQPAGDRFQIDFDQVAQKLKPVVAKLEQPKGRKGKDITGQGIVDQLVKTDKWGDSEGPFVLGSTEGIEVTVGLGRTGIRFDRDEEGKRVDKFQTRGPVLAGPLATDYEDRTKLVPPSVSITIARQSEERYRLPPAIDPEMKERMKKLGAEIKAAFLKK